MKGSLSRTEGDTLVFSVELDTYGLDPLLKAAHKFTGRCYVHLEHEGRSKVLCRLRGKAQPAGDELAGEFLNELLDQTLRARLAAATEPVRRVLLAQAFSKINLLHPELDGADPTADPERIGIPDDPHLE